MKKSQLTYGVRIRYTDILLRIKIYSTFSKVNMQRSVLYSDAQSKLHYSAFDFETYPIALITIKDESKFTMDK